MMLYIYRCIIYIYPMFDVFKIILIQYIYIYRCKTGWCSELKNWPKSHGITESPHHRPQQLQSLHNVAVDQVALFETAGVVLAPRLDLCGFKRDQRCSAPQWVQMSSRCSSEKTTKNYAKWVQVSSSSNMFKPPKFMWPKTVFWMNIVSGKRKF